MARETADKTGLDLLVIPNGKKLVAQKVKPSESEKPPTTPEPAENVYLNVPTIEKIVAPSKLEAEINAALLAQKQAVRLPEMPLLMNEITVGGNMTSLATANIEKLSPVVENESDQSDHSVLEPILELGETEPDVEMPGEVYPSAFSDEEITAILAEVTGESPDDTYRQSTEPIQETTLHSKIADTELVQAQELLPETIQESLLAYVESAGPEQVAAIEAFVLQMAAGAARLETLYGQGDTSGEEVVAIEAVLMEWYEELLVILEIPHDAKTIQKFIISLHSIPQRASIEDVEHHYDNGMQEQKLGFISLARQLAQALRQKLQFMKLARFVVQASTA